MDELEEKRTQLLHSTQTYPWEGSVAEGDVVLKCSPRASRREVTRHGGSVSRRYFKYASSPVSDCRRLVFLPSSPSLAWPREISAGPILVSAVRVMSPDDTRQSPRGQADRQACFSLAKRRVPRISRFPLVRGTDCFRRATSASRSLPSRSPVHSISRRCIARRLAPLPATSSSLFFAKGGRRERARAGEWGLLFGATVPRPDTFYRAVNAGCGGLVRSTESLRGRREIYRASRFFPLRADPRLVASLARSTVFLLLNSDLVPSPDCRPPTG